MESDRDCRCFPYSTPLYLGPVLPPSSVGLSLVISKDARAETSSFGFDRGRFLFYVLFDQAIGVNKCGLLPFMISEAQEHLAPVGSLSWELCCGSWCWAVGCSSGFLDRTKVVVSLLISCLS